MVLGSRVSYVFGGAVGLRSCIADRPQSPRLPEPLSFSVLTVPSPLYIIFIVHSILPQNVSEAQSLPLVPWSRSRGFHNHNFTYPYLPFPRPFQSFVLSSKYIIQNIFVFSIL